jgi:hypothetical protein
MRRRGGVLGILGVGCELSCLTGSVEIHAGFGYY